MVNRIILSLPSYCVSPDGHILWAMQMQCGCKCIKVIEREYNYPENIDVLVEACNTHYHAAQIKLNTDHCKHLFYESIMLAVLETDDLE